MGFASASGWAKVSFFVSILGAALMIAGWATLNWMVYESSNGQTVVNVGLFQIYTCQGGACNTYGLSDVYKTDLYIALQVLETLGMIVSIFLVVFIGIYVFVDAARTQPAVRVAMVLGFFTGLVIFVGMILCLVNVPSPYVVSFSLGLTVLAYLLILISAALLVPDSCEEKPYY